MIHIFLLRSCDTFAETCDESRCLTSQLGTSDGGSISKVGGPKTNDQIFFTYNQNRQWRSEKLQNGGGHNFHFFQASFFFNRTILKLIKKQEKLSGGPGACSPRKFLKIYVV